MRWLIQRKHEGKRLGIFREFLPRTMDGVLMEMDFDTAAPFSPCKNTSTKSRRRSPVKLKAPNRVTFRGKTSSDLVHQYLKKPASLTPKELQFLGKEATYHDRHLLELELDPNHPLLQTINQNFQIKTDNGFDLIL